MTHPTPPRILVIAGSDSSGGAGIQADIKTITMLGGYAMTAITAITAQNTQGVTMVEALSPELIGAQIEACVSDIGVDAVKIGMLGSPAIAHLVADRIEGLAVPVVFDPVMIATSGAVLADAETIAAFERLMAMATLTTPNVPELAALGGAAGMAARGVAYLAKGGDAEGPVVEDRLVLPHAAPQVWQAPRIATRHTHGTGCTLASAIATGLGAGQSLVAAVERARHFVALALRDAPGFGAGHGPLGHAMVRQDLPLQPALNQVTLPVGDLSATLAFWRDLGFEPRVDSPANGYARLVSPGGTTLSLHAGAAPAVYCECADLDGVVARLRGQGLTVSDPVDQPWRWREAWTRDPSGNRLCLYTAGVDRRYPPWAIPLSRSLL